MTSISCLGEPLIELSPTQTDTYRLGVAGDVLNTAAAMSCLGINSQLITALGNNALSDRICQFAANYGVDTSNVIKVQGQQPGLYMIDNDDTGERFFSYWRDNSAAKNIFSNTEQLASLLATISPPWLYLSGITLALFSDESARIFFNWCKNYTSQGNKIIYDNNYRPLLWPSRAIAEKRNKEMLHYCEVFLPSVEDQAALLNINEAQALAYLKQVGVNEIVIKQGTMPLTIIRNKECVEFLVTPATAIDTTGAGDAFNGGYLSARLSGMPVEQAAKQAMQLSALTVQQKGAVLAPEEIKGLS